MLLPDPERCADGGQEEQTVARRLLRAFAAVVTDGYDYRTSSLWATRFELLRRSASLDRFALTRRARD